MSVPVSTTRPARTMLTRSAVASTSDRMWLDSSTVRPSARAWDDLLLEHLLHQGVEAGGRLVEEQEGDVGGEGGDEGDLLAVALGVRAALLGRVELERLEQLVALAPVDPAPEPSEQVDDLTAGEVGPQDDIARDVGELAVQLGGVVPGVAPEQA